MRSSRFREVDITRVLEWLDWELPPCHGGWTKIHCGFHEDRTPSATVNIDLGKVHCFSCGFHGDAYDVVAAARNMSLAEAADIVNEVHGGTVKPTSGRSKRRYTPPGRRGRVR